MRTVNRKPVLWGVGMLLGALLLAVGTVRADVVTDQAAGLIIFPKLVFNSDYGLNTEIQLSNTSGHQISVRCFYVNANSHCSNFPEEICNTNEDCVFESRPNGSCLPGWVETDFHFQLTAFQPIIWLISEGLPDFPLDGVDRISHFNTFNEDSSIPPVSEDPFIGELKCFEVGDDEQPITANDLKAEVTIVRANDYQPLDARGYNGIGIKAKLDVENDGVNTLVLGQGGEYNGCPNILIIDHFFDDAIVFAEERDSNTAFVRSDLTFVPCSENFELQNVALFETKLQFLVYNEFEQRFSTSTGVECFREIPLSDIDTRPRPLFDGDPASTGDKFSIFNIALQGTLTGQTRIRPVDDGSPAHGNGVVAVAEEFHRSDPDDLFSVRASAAFQVDHVGERTDPDFIVVPAPTFP